MALGDRMASRFSQSSTSVSSHLDEFSSRDDGDSSGQRRESDAVAGANSSLAVSSLAYLPQTVFLGESRHEGFEECVPMGPSESGLVSKWRPKDRMKTGCVALVVCLNIGVDPPDVIKISPCARMECWIDPFSMTAPKALETIGKSLQVQYERWQPRARYRLQLDPTVEEVKKLCSSSRKNARSERVLFHYNGHGVPKPTVNGEIWVFNKSYTQYIPLPISELDSWLKTPSIYVFDCSAAGIIVNAFIELNSSGSSKDCILLAACEAHENLPQSAEFPEGSRSGLLSDNDDKEHSSFCSTNLD
ncbi:regulatory-associated protein of TOR 1-like [Phalaenopsis equestris]|uniref:regulatory-associated protein of TOR 1-like n=1 Tax=Phalaenopsis equestris TaxID=78828 RepID=UPI0009E201F4|nr:regulatory-associated protein of TOR 1-like [Phalaenopsis equestris]